MPPAASNRLYYLDALRSFAILYGILVHVATIGVPPGLQWISEVSGYFRMGAFFLVSGYFTGMMMARYSTGEFLRRRSIALLVPLAAGLVLLNPVTNWLVFTYHNVPISFPDYLMAVVDGLELPGDRGPMIWHLHLWFLISLFVYVLTAPVFAALVRRVAGPARALADRLADWPAWATILVVAVVAGAVGVGLRVLYELTLVRVVDPFTRFRWLFMITTYYWPFFLAGMAFHAHRRLGDRFQSFSLPPFLIGLALVWGVARLPLPSPLDEAARLFARTVLTMAIIAGLMAFFRRYLNRETWLSRAADYVYSIYIMHFLVIYLVAHALRPLGLGPYADFVLVAALTYAIVFALHRFVIRPTPLLSLLFNGKPMRAGRAPAPRPAPPKG